jgi:hypothetical protein
MEQSSSREANSHSTSQEIPHQFLNSKVHYYAHSSLVSILSIWLQPTTSHPMSIRSNLILPQSMPSSYEWSFPLRFPKQNFVGIFHFFHGRYMSRPYYPPWFHHPNNIWWRLEAKYLTKSINYDAPHYVIFSFLLLLFSGPNIHSTKTAATLSLRSFHTATDQVLHPYKQQVELINAFETVVKIHEHKKYYKHYNASLSKYF